MCCLREVVASLKSNVHTLVSQNHQLHKTQQAHASALVRSVAHFHTLEQQQNTVRSELTALKTDVAILMQDVAAIKVIAWRDFRLLVSS